MYVLCFPRNKSNQIKSNLTRIVLDVNLFVPFSRLKFGVSLGKEVYEPVDPAGVGNLDREKERKIPLRHYLC